MEEAIRIVCECGHTAQQHSQANPYGFCRICDCMSFNPKRKDDDDE